MSTITSLKLGSVPITEDGVERYKFSDTITNHFTQIFEFTEDLNCSVGRIFSKVKVPVSWFTVMNANYLIAEMDINNPSGSVLHIKAWIDAIDLLSDSEDHPMVEIRWHFDYYEMFKSSVTLGYGHIKRRPYADLDTTPVQNYPYRFFELPSDFKTTKVDLFDQYHYTYSSRKYTLWWTVVSYNVTKTVTVGGNTYNVTEIQHAFAPFGVPDESNSTYEINPFILTHNAMSIKDTASPPNTATSPGYNYVMNGQLDEAMGIDPTTINGIWVVPSICPSSMLSGTGDISDPLIISGSWRIRAGRGQWGVFYISTDENYIKWSTSITSVTSTEKERYIVMNYDGSKAWELPYGMTASSYEIYTFYEATSCYAEISFRDETSGVVEGMTATIIFPTLPVNYNALSSYMYSGQQEYDREARTIASNASAWKSSASGGGQGAMMGAFGAPGLALGVAGGVSGGLINYGVEMLYQNDEEQRILDRLKANQSSSIIMGSDAGHTVVRSRGIFLTKIQMDGYSATQADNTKSNFGISVDEILSSCNTQVKTTAPTGYYIIKNLIISGSAPKEAKDYIKKKFDAGVRLL